MTSAKNNDLTSNHRHNNNNNNNILNINIFYFYFAAVFDICGNRYVVGRKGLLTYFFGGAARPRKRVVTQKHTREPKQSVKGPHYGATSFLSGLLHAASWSSFRADFWA